MATQPVLQINKNVAEVLQNVDEKPTGKRRGRKKKIDTQTLTNDYSLKPSYSLRKYKK